MWTYFQKSGELADPDGEIVSIGYSGSLWGKNNPAAQAVPNVGPIPRGTYSIADPRDSPTHGPCVLPLTRVGGQSFGRSAFLIHGDGIRHPGAASQGCIVLDRTTRDEIAASDDRILRVLATPAPGGHDRPGPQPPAPGPRPPRAQCAKPPAPGGHHRPGPRPPAPRAKRAPHA